MLTSIRGFAGALALAATVGAGAPVAAQEEAPMERQRTGGYLGLFLQEAGGQVTIERVREGSGAAAAGFQAGDVVTEVNGRSLEHGDQLVQTLWSRRPLRVTVRRGAESVTIATSTADLDAVPAVGDAAPKFVLPTKDGNGMLGLEAALATGRPVVLVFGSFT